ncbi:MAG: divergent polysaccharide deacetylase family protein [Kangiellaceae bacterium]|nr:divergent polysaccharide deacetylase family protein [Kangiellaceae bacterium]
MKFEFIPRLATILLLLLSADLTIADTQPIQKSTTKPKISIVIDDLGDNSIIARQMLALPGKMTAAILPHTPHAKIISEFASTNGHDVIMHIPMEAQTRPDLLGPGALFSTMDKATFLKTFAKSIESIPSVIGFNNHMGSLLTKDSEKMQWLMTEAKSRSLLFLDSKTTGLSVAESVAEQQGVPTIGRDIFLDNKEGSSSIEEQFIRSQMIAAREGHVVIICHPYPETLAFLKKNIVDIQQGFELVGLGSLFDSDDKVMPISQPSLAK